MNRNAIRIAAAAITGLALSIPVAQAQSTANSPQARAKQSATQGPDQLRRFIHRTRMVYGLSFNDFYKPE